MSRTQKKCFIASTGVHLLLLLVLLFGPAFLSSGDKIENSEVLTFIPMIPTDAKVSNPGAAPAQQQNTPPAQQQTAQVTPPVVPPQPQPKPQPERTPDPEPPKIIKPNPEALEAEKPPKTKPKPQISTTIVTRNTSEVRRKAEKQAAQAAAAEQQRLARLFGTATSSLKGGLSGSTDIKFSDGIGGGTGPAYANWFSILQTYYDRAWDVPESINDDTANVKASVTISRDGTVLSWSITVPSGNSAVDRSVRAALERVTQVAAFPEGAKEEQRTVVINFNLKAHKQLLG